MPLWTGWPATRTPGIATTVRQQTRMCTAMRLMATLLLVTPVAGWLGAPLTALRSRAAAASGHRRSHPVLAELDGAEVLGAAALAAANVGGASVLLKRMRDEDRKPALASGRVEAVEDRGTDDGSDEGVDAAVIVVGAGAAGIGFAITLTKTFGLDPSRVLLVEKGDGVGTSFRQWPEEMRFISPSFNSEGWTNSFDLNSVAHGSSPAYELHAQHPSGSQYADYLDDLCGIVQLKKRVKRRCEVLRVEKGPDGAFDVRVRSRKADGAEREDTLRSRYVVWAAGEFQYPREGGDCVGGAELCLHNSRVSSWASLDGDERVVIGGYESGVDAAVNLAKAGKQATVLASTATWNVQTVDPSSELAPYTADRLREVTAEGFSPSPKLLAPLRVQRVERAPEGGFNVVAAWKAADNPLPLPDGLRKPFVTRAESTARWLAEQEGGDAAPFASLGTITPPGAEGSEVVVHTAQPPVLCTGFEGSVASVARNLFAFADEADEAKGCLCGAAMLTDDDESTAVPGVFLVGPSVSHGDLSFCFVYKFRQRFGIVADKICRGLGRDTAAAVAECRKTNMYLDDLSCCVGSCGTC
mmetsp:Transcript_16992/g.49272  ORF Transcript_16992/g.49272 Transcript_16992/m.49272 type:complete len:584 (-) Transcript_16992:86-1837(-)